jgi:membrane protein DedA with SNARE-associated domain
VDNLNELILMATASPWLPLVMFAIAMLDGFFPPVPSETVLVAAAAVAATTGAVPTVLLLCVLAAAGAMIGDNLAYAVGRAVGVRRWAWMRKPRAAAVFARAGATLDKRGAPLILGARYIPVGRVAVNMTAGALRYPRRRFVPLSALAAVTWAAYCAAIGLLAGQWLEDQPLVSAAIGVAVALLTGLVIDRIAAARRTRASRDSSVAEDAPAPAVRESATLAECP